MISPSRALCTLPDLNEDIYEHTGSGINRVVGVLIYFFVGIVTLFLLPVEIKRMYEHDGKQSPVGPATAFWILLFGIPWYVKCQGASTGTGRRRALRPPEPGSGQARRVMRTSTSRASADPVL